jgi:hypothetical protein
MFDRDRELKVFNISKIKNFLNDTLHSWKVVSHPFILS